MPVLPCKSAIDGARSPIKGGLSRASLGLVCSRLNGLPRGLLSRRRTLSGDASPTLPSRKHTSTHLPIQRIGESSLFLEAFNKTAWVIPNAAV
jgi:hypothetical protein